MRLLLISNLFPTNDAPHGGIFVTKRIEALRNRGVAIDAVAIASSGSPSTLGSTFENATYRQNAFSKLASRITYPRSLVQILAQQILERRPDASYDVIQAHGAYFPPAAGIAAAIGQELRVPVVITLHGSDVNKVMRRQPRPFVRSLQQAARVIYVSNDLKAAAARLGAPTTAAVVIPNGVDTSVFKTHSGAKRRYDVVFVGSLLPVKGSDRIPNLVQAISQLRPNTTFAVVGDGPLLAQIRRGLSHMSTQVAFLGSLPQTEVARVLANSKGLILPSRSEGWPCTILEAHASGCWVVGTDVGGIREAIGSAEFVVANGRKTVHDLAEVTVRMLRDTPDTDVYRHRSMSYDWDVLAEAEARTLGDACSQRPGTR